MIRDSAAWYVMRSTFADYFAPITRLVRLVQRVRWARIGWIWVALIFASSCYYLMALAIAAAFHKVWK